jgi:Arc/MetJ-type ribon-helix-helix transcriptional regulator
MSISLTSANKKLIKTLLRVGRWGNESEIVRYGLHLVARELELEQRRSLEPIPRGLLAQAYRKLGSDEIEQDRILSRASAYSM